LLFTKQTDERQRRTIMGDKGKKDKQKKHKQKQKKQEQAARIALAKQPAKIP